MLKWDRTFGLREGLGCFLVIVAGTRLFIKYYRPRHFPFEGVSAHDHSSTHSTVLAMKAQKMGLRVFSEPLIDFFGIPLLKRYRITDAELAREFFNTEKAQGHMDFKGFFSMMAQYRELAKKKGAFKISEREAGVMRDLGSENKTDTTVMKLIRKRFLEFTSSAKQFQSNLSRVLKESDDLIEIALKKSQDGLKAIEPHSMVMEATVNTGFALTVGYSMKQSTQELHDKVVQLDKLIGYVLEVSNHKIIFMFMPRFLRKFIPLKYWPAMCDPVSETYDFILDCVDKHAENYNQEDEPVCLIDMMRQDFLQGRITYSDIFHTVWGSLLAAGDTTSMSTCIMWSNLARWPEWQKRIQNEIENSTVSSIEKFEHLPCAAAFFYETWRWLPTHFQSLNHCATKKVELDGFSFGRDTMFSMSTAGIGMNPEYFPDPFKFDPNRFLDENGGLKRNKNMLGPFGYGKRSCPGQAIAELQVLLYTVNLLRRCNINMDPERPLLKPKNEEEWLSLFSRRPSHAPQGAFLLVKNMRITISERDQ